MMISMDEVIAEVARKNGHGLAPDDPALFLITVVNCIADGYEKQNAELVEKYRSYLKEYREEHQTFHQEAALQWRNDARDFAKTVLNTGLTSGRDTAVKLMTEGATKILAMVKEELGQEREAHLLAEKEEFHKLKRYLAWMVGATGVSLVSAVAMVLLLER